MHKMTFQPPRNLLETTEPREAESFDVLGKTKKSTACPTAGSLTIALRKCNKNMNKTLKK